jgi:hypothetical protein
MLNELRISCGDSSNCHSDAPEPQASARLLLGLVERSVRSIKPEHTDATSHVDHQTLTPEHRRIIASL